MYFNSRWGFYHLRSNLFCILLVGVCGLSILNAPAQANDQTVQRSRSVIALSCTVSGEKAGAKSGAKTRILCQALQQKLAQPLPHYVFRMLPEPQTMRGRAGDLFVNFNIDNMHENHVGAHLEWRHGTMLATHVGPKVSVGIPQAGLTFSTASELAEALLEASPEMFAEPKN